MKTRVLFLVLLCFTTSLFADSGCFVVGSPNAGIYWTFVNNSGTLPNGSYTLTFSYSWTDTQAGTGSGNSSVGFSVSSGTGSTTYTLSGPFGEGIGSATFSNFALSGHPEIAVTASNTGYRWAPTGTPTDGHTTVNLAPAPKHPQPLDVTGKSVDGKAHTWMVKDPNGNVVLTFGVGAGLTVSSQWTPSDTPTTGTYYFGVSDDSGLHASIIGSTVLSAATSGSYSYVWSNPDPSGSYGSAATASGANGAVTNNSGRDINLSWVDQNHNVIASMTVPNGSSAPINAPSITLPTGGTLTLTLDDTTDGVSLGSVQVVNTGDGPPQTSGTINAIMNPPAPTLSSTSSQTNTGNQSVGVSGNNNTPNTLVNNSNTTVVAATNEDIYNDVKQAILDAGQQQASSAVSPTDGSFNYGNQPSYSASDANGIQSDVTTATQSVSGMVDGVSSQWSTSNALKLPAIGGSNTQVMHVPSIGPVAAFTVDISPYAQRMTVFRVLCLVALLITAWFFAVKIIRGGVS